MSREYKKDPNELGALWEKTGPKGKYMTGTIGGVKVVCFAATHRSEKSPDWRVLKSNVQGAGPSGGPRTERPMNLPQSGASPIEDDIPFE